MRSARASPGGSKQSSRQRVDEIAIVASVPGEPPDADQRLQVILDPDDPTKSVAIMPTTAADPPSE